MKKHLNNQGLTLIEMMVTLVIVLLLLASVTMTLNSGQDAWRTAGGQTELRENLRVVLSRVSKELRETGSSGAGVSQLTIGNNTGTNSSDIITFSLPVTCHAGDSLMDSNGNVANWGAPLTWGCTASTCMDADNNCGTVDYKSVQYRINSSNQLERRVLNNVGNAVRTEVFADGITNFQIVFNGEDSNMNCVINGGEDANGNGKLNGGASVTLTINGRVTTAKNRQLTSSAINTVFLRNKGCAI